MAIVLKGNRQLTIEEHKVEDYMIILINAVMYFLKGIQLP